METLNQIMGTELAKQMSKVTLAKDDEMIWAFGPDCPHEPLRIRGLQFGMLAGIRTHLTPPDLAAAAADVVTATSSYPPSRIAVACLRNKNARTGSTAVFLFATESAAVELFSASLAAGSQTIQMRHVQPQLEPD